MYKIWYSYKGEDNTASVLDYDAGMNELLDFCLLNNLSRELDVFKNTIKECFSNIISLAFQLYSDPEIGELYHLTAKVIIADSIKNMLDMEQLFYSNVCNKIIADKLRFFLLECDRYDIPR